MTSIQKYKVQHERFGWQLTEHEQSTLEIQERETTAVSSGDQRKWQAGWG